MLDTILYLPFPVAVGHIVFVLGLATISSPFWLPFVRDSWRAEG